MRRASWLCLILILVSGASGQLLAQDLGFQLLRGRAALSRNKGSTWLDLGPEPIAVKAYDMLRSEGDTRGELRYPDGSVFRMKSDTLLTLLPDGVQLQVGDTWFNLQKQGRAFKVVTPTTVCGVLGTNFDVNVDRFGKTRVRVFEGIVTAKAHDDRRRRQLVLQRGMMTTVRDKDATDDQPQRFNTSAVEASLRSEWDTRRLPPMKIGPDRPELPPIRPESPGTWQRLEKDPTLDGPGEPKPDPNSLRERMNFFEGLQDRQLRERRLLEGDERRPGTPSGLESSSVFRTQPKGFSSSNLPRSMYQQGHGTAFGQGDQHPTGVQDQRQLRDEIMRVTTDLSRNSAELSRVGLEIQSLRTKVSSGQAGDVTTRKQRLAQLLSQRQGLLEAQRKLGQRLENLRNRMR